MTKNNALKSANIKFTHVNQGKSFIRNIQHKNKYI